MRILVTGASGFIGSHLARRLAGAGHQVRALLRKPGDAALLEGAAVERVAGDITDPASLPGAVAACDLVYHLAGIRRSPSAADFIRVNVDGTRNVLAALAAMDRPARVVFASSLAAVGPSTPERPHVEDDPLRPSEVYGESKAAAERVCAEYAARVPIAIARPPRVVGPGDRENLAFFKLVRRGIKLRVTGPPRPLSMIDVDDLLDALIALGEHAAAPGQAFFVAAAETITVEALLDLAARTVEAKPRTVPLPPSVLLGLATIADGVSTLTGRHLPLNRKLARQLLAPAWTCSGEKARRLLGFEPKIPLAQSVDRAARWYREQGWI